MEYLNPDQVKLINLALSASGRFSLSLSSQILSDELKRRELHAVIADHPNNWTIFRAERIKFDDFECLIAVLLGHDSTARHLLVADNRASAYVELSQVRPCSLVMKEFNDRRFAQVFDLEGLASRFGFHGQQFNLFKSSL